MSDLVVDIAVGVSVNKTFHYLASEPVASRLAPGSRVLVPFGSRRLIGTVVGFPQTAEKSDLKNVIEIAEAPIPADLLTLAQWMADYYLYPLGQTIETIVPKALSRTKPKKEVFIRLLADPASLQLKGKKQTELVAILSERGKVLRDDLDNIPAQTIKALHNAGVIEITERNTAAAQAADSVSPGNPPPLMPEQAEAVRKISEAICNEDFGTFLLHGVTGSGKTEVYLHAIAKIAGTGKGSIVLVPEIALTPQLVNRFKQRFGNRTAVLHSGLTDRERADEYRRILCGSVDVVIGARSAVFAPFDKIGIIIVDEEHENSYKQDEGLRYHARDVAVMRAKLQNAVAVLGSATPSLESYYNAKNGKYTYLHLPNRVDHRPMPEVTVVDAKTLQPASLYSPLLIEHIRQRLANNEQTLLLLNRRGFSSVLICRDCGTAVKCPGCSVSLTYHKSEQKLKCHYCGFHTRPPDKCPVCFSIEMKLVGSGTQKIEEELQTLFPEARLRRMDSDTVKGRNAYDSLLQQVDRREIDILLGTQMIAKGHDFPAVTLVGVVDADTGLNLPDLRAAEKTFQLITQAAGRAGRGELGGGVIIQTMNPGHYSIRHSRTHDYEGFYNEEIAYRAELRYPPFTRIIKLEIKSAQESCAAGAAKTAHDRIRSRMRGKDVMLLGPAPAPISRVRGQYRFHLLLLSEHREKIRALAVEGKKAVEESNGRKCRVLMDVDPVNLM